MDAQKRQKTMLVAAAVFSVGAGSYWFLGRDSDAVRPQALAGAEMARKPRVQPEAPPRTRKPESKPPAPEPPSVAPRKPHEEAPANADRGRKTSRPERAPATKRTPVQGC
jgi:outer membrane biosynthesis protein TonB